MLRRELKKAGLSLSRLSESGDMEKFAREELRDGSEEELYSAVGYGKLSAAAVMKKLRGDKEPQPEPTPGRIRSLFRRPKSRDSETGIRVSGQADVLVRFGGCCNPLPGDDVSGFVTRGRGVTVHVSDCSRVFELDPDRRIDVAWESDSIAPRQVKIRVRSEDQPGILAKVTNTISDLGLNIGAAKISTSEGEHAVQIFELGVADSALLQRLIKQISKIRGVVSVERIRG